MAKKKKDDDEKQEESGGSIAVNDAWTGMLVIALLALIVATGFLAYDLFVRYDRYNVDPSKVSVPRLTGKPPEKPLEKKDEKEKNGDKKKDEKIDDKKEDKKDGARLRVMEHYAATQRFSGDNGPFTSLRCVRGSDASFHATPSISAILTNHYCRSNVISL